MFSEAANDQIVTLFAAWQSALIVGDDAEQRAARAAMGGALSILRLHYADDSLFFSLAEDPLGLSRTEVLELIDVANGEEPSAIPV